MDKLISFEELDCAEGKKWNSKCSAPDHYDSAFVRLLPSRRIVFRNYLKYLERLRDFEIRKDDVWVVSFPRSGTTWVQEMVWCIANDLDFEGAKQNLEIRFPFFEQDAERPPILSDLDDTLKQLEHLEKPRFIKSHLHYNLLPNSFGKVGPKLIYIARNPKDTCLSYFHLLKLFNNYTGDLTDFINSFVTDMVSSAPYWPHLRDFWDRRDESNVLFLTYEDMQNDLATCIEKTGHYLGKELTTDQIQILSQHISFQSMKHNPAVNLESTLEQLSTCRKTLDGTHQSGFIRVGKVDSWKDEMALEQIVQLDDWITKNGIPGLY